MGLTGEVKVVNNKGLRTICHCGLLDWYAKFCANMMLNCCQMKKATKAIKKRVHSVLNGNVKNAIGCGNVKWTDAL